MVCEGSGLSRRWGWALVAIGAALTTGGCPRETTRPATSTQPASVTWPGSSGRVNRLVAWRRGTGRLGFAVVVNTMEIYPDGRVNFALEDGAFSFRLYPADPTGQPILEKPLGAWDFDVAAARQHWSPGGWGGNATYTFLLPWNGPAPPVGTTLVLVSQFTPQGRAPTPTHLLVFTVDPSGGVGL